MLGGGSFAGPAIIDAALDRGDDVTVLNRGLTSEVPQGVRHVIADRTQTGWPDALGDEDFDLVVDTWSGAPSVVHDSASQLSERATRYAYVSSISVYADPLAVGFDESSPTVEASPTADATTYPADKRGAELAVEAAFGGDRCLLARAGLIVGPRENSGRLLWWLRRVAHGGDVLAPGPPDQDLQLIDVRDLARFVLTTSASEACNTVSRHDHATTRRLLDACRSATGSAARLVWATPEELEAHDVSGWTDLPLWLPGSDPIHAILTADTTKAISGGLACRPVEATVAETWAWLTTVPDHALPNGVGLDEAREAEVLKAIGHESR
jgi:nucleoside-diphosphate-sugar epimerase